MDAIRKELLSEWDPIGIWNYVGPGAADDEYDSHIPGIYLLVQARANTKTLVS